MTTLDITENLATSLEMECARAGTNLTEVCKMAGVHRGTVQRWKDNEPKTIREVRGLLKAIEDKRKEKQK